MTALSKKIFQEKFLYILGFVLWDCFWEIFLLTMVYVMKLEDLMKEFSNAFDILNQALDEY